MVGVAPCSRTLVIGGNLDLTRRLPLSLTSPERLRIAGRSGAQHRVVGWLDAPRQDQRIEDEIATIAGCFALCAIDCERADVDAFAITWPSHRRVVGHIARLPDGNDQMPLDGPAREPRNDIVEEIVVVRARALLGRRRRKRLARRHRPTYGSYHADRIDEAECVEAIVAGVGEA